MKFSFSVISALVIISFISTGCTTVDPYTRQEKTANATTGSVIGAMAGAAVGGLTSSKEDRTKGILTGVAAGAALGGGIGYYMDVQEAKLKQQLDQTGVQVIRNGNIITLEMPNSITFATDSSTLKTSAIEALDSVSKVLSEFDKTNIRVIGHTDNTGRKSYNQLLSEKRAQSVANELMHAGLSSYRVDVDGVGASQPIASNNTKDGRAQNRRVEITLTPMG